MPDQSPHGPPSAPEQAEIVVPPDVEAEESRGDAIEQPAKVMRVGAMLRGLLAEVREASLDERSRDRLRDIYEISLQELGSALSADLRAELDRLTQPFPDSEVPSEGELRVAKAQLVGWLEGLIQGIQATLYAQQVLARAQLADMRGQLPQFSAGGATPPGAAPPGAAPMAEERPGTYL